MPCSEREAVARAARERSERERANNVFRRGHFTHPRMLSTYKLLIAASTRGAAGYGAGESEVPVSNSKASA